MVTNSIFRVRGTASFFPKQMHHSYVSYMVFFFFSFWPHYLACGILVPWPGIEPSPPAVVARSLNHWTIRKSLHGLFLGVGKIMIKSSEFTWSDNPLVLCCWSWAQKPVCLPWNLFFSQRGGHKQDHSCKVNLRTCESCLRCYYYNLLKAQMMISIFFSNTVILKIKVLHYLFRYNAIAHLRAYSIVQTQFMYRATKTVWFTLLWYLFHCCGL